MMKRKRVCDKVFINFFQEKSGSLKLRSCIENHDFIQSISILVPNTISLDHRLISVLDDHKYYSGLNVPVKKLVSCIDTCGITADKNAEVDDFCNVVNGAAYLSLSRDTSLGLKLAASGCTTTSRLLYKVGNKFEFDIEMDMVFDKAIPGLDLKEVALTHSQRVDYNIKVPSISTDNEELFEWVGVQCLGGEKEDDPFVNEYIGAYEAPEGSKDYGQCVFHNWYGIISKIKVLELYDKILEFVNEKHSVPFVIMNIVGFDNCIESKGKNICITKENCLTFIISESYTKMCHSKEYV